MDLALNNLQRLICHKTQQNKTIMQVQRGYKEAQDAECPFYDSWILGKFVNNFWFGWV